MPEDGDEIRVTRARMGRTGATAMATATFLFHDELRKAGLISDRTDLAR